MGGPRRPCFPRVIVVNQVSPLSPFWRLGHRAGQELCEAMSANKSLSTLVLGGCGLTEAALASLGTCLAAHNYSLKELVVDSNPTFGEEGRAVLGKAFAGCLTCDFFRAQYGRLESLSLCKVTESALNRTPTPLFQNTCKVLRQR